MSFPRLFKGHAPKKSAISKTAERDFEREIKKLDQLEEDTKKLYKDVKRCTESQHGQCRCEVKMTQDLLNSALCREDDELRKNVENWNNTTQRLEVLMNELTANSQKTVMDPMKKFSTIFPSAREAAKKREQSLQEYTKCQTKVDKYQEKERTGPNVVKLETASTSPQRRLSNIGTSSTQRKISNSRKALTSAKEDFEAQNHSLMEDLPRLSDQRVNYFQPSFQALIKSQMKYYTECHKLYSDLSSSMNEGPDDIRDDDYRQRLQQKLTDIRALSIVVDD